MITSFHVLKPRITRGDIYYKVYVTDTELHFIKLGGQFHSRDAVENQLPDLIGLLFLFGYKKREKKQAEIEKEFDRKIETNQVSDLLQKRPNFSINQNHIQEIILNKKRTMHTGFHDNGTITLKLTYGKTLKFIIPRTTLRSEIKRALKEVEPPISINE